MVNIMKKIVILVSIFLTSIFLLTGCADRSSISDPDTANTGSVDFSSFVTIGNSLTSGYQNGSLYETGQEYSFGNLIAAQVGTDFVQPLVSNPGTVGRLEIVSLEPLIIKANTESGAPLNLTYQKAYNNIGIPGATLYDVLNATNSDNCMSGLAGSPNPLFDMVLRGNGTQFEQAKSLNPTFITLWIGNNDILGHASSGGTVPFTPAVNFDIMYHQLADSIATLGAKVAVANIPSVSSIPFFTTVPAALADAEGNIISLYGETESGVRVLVPGHDLLTLKATAVLLDESGQPTGVGLSEANPLPDAVVLDSDEVTNVEAVTDSYNLTIETVVNENDDFILVDMKKFFLGVVADGHEENGILFTSDFITGKLFGLDGVHGTNRGYGVLANEFLRAVNDKFEAKIPMINVSTLPGSIPLEM